MDKQNRSKKPRREAAESGPASAGFGVCPSCKAVHYQKRWRHDFPSKLGSLDKALRFVSCPACKMIQGRLFEGQVLIEGVFVAMAQEVINRIVHVGERAFLRDPLDRIISIRRRGATIEVLTTENQLALHIAREVQQMLRRGKFEVRFSREESVLRARVYPR